MDTAFIQLERLGNGYVMRGLNKSSDTSMHLVHLSLGDHIVEQLIDIATTYSVEDYTSVIASYTTGASNGGDTWFYELRPFAHEDGYWHIVGTHLYGVGTTGVFIDVLFINRALCDEVTVDVSNQVIHDGD